MEGFPYEYEVCYKAFVRGYVWKEEICVGELVSQVDFSIRNLVALVAHLDLELAQLNLKTAFIHGNLEEIYVTQPDGYEIVDLEIGAKFEHGLDLVVVLHI